MDGGGRERRLRIEMNLWPLWLARRSRAGSGRSQLQCIQQENYVQSTPAKGLCGRLVQIIGVLKLAVVLRRKTSS